MFSNALDAANRFEEQFLRLRQTRFRYSGIYASSDRVVDLFVFAGFESGFEVDFTESLELAD